MGKGWKTWGQRLSSKLSQFVVPLYFGCGYKATFEEGYGKKPIELTSVLSWSRNLYIGLCFPNKCLVYITSGLFSHGVVISFMQVESIQRLNCSLNMDSFKPGLCSHLIQQQVLSPCCKETGWWLGPNSCPSLSQTRSKEVTDHCFKQLVCTFIYHCSDFFS